MKNPYARMVTLCPNGMSQLLSDYLNKTSQRDGQSLIKDLIAEDLLSVYTECELPFAGCVIAWSRTGELAPDGLQEWLQKLSALTIEDGTEAVSFECFIQAVDHGTIAIGGFYPIASAGPESYLQASLLIRDQLRTELLDRSYTGVLAGALGSDPTGAMIAILADDSLLAELKIQEAITLLLPVE